MKHLIDATSRAWMNRDFPHRFDLRLRPEGVEVMLNDHRHRVVSWMEIEAARANPITAAMDAMIRDHARSDKTEGA